MNQTALTSNKTTGHNAGRQKYHTLNKVFFDFFYCDSVWLPFVQRNNFPPLPISIPFFSISFFHCAFISALCFNLLPIRHMLPLPLQPSPKAYILLYCTAPESPLSQTQTRLFYFFYTFLLKPVFFFIFSVLTL